MIDGRWMVFEEVQERKSWIELGYNLWLSTREGVSHERLVMAFGEVAVR